MRNILIVGAGGIGSWLAYQINHLNQHNQLSNTLITFADNDTVDNKNIPYQLFDNIDLLDNKAECIANRYRLEFIDKRIERDSQLEKYDLIISAVDNAKFRALMFKFCDKHPKVHWIDLRSEGRAVAFYTKHKENTLEKMLSTLPDPNNDEDGSCQLAYELEANIVQLGNRIIAAIGAQLILNWYRNEPSPPKFIMHF